MRLAIGMNEATALKMAEIFDSQISNHETIKKKPK
jgi:hypothetical protein